MAKRKQLPQINGITVHCAICVQQGKREPAFTVIKSYAVCEPHILLASRPDFDIFALHTNKGQPA